MRINLLEASSKLDSLKVFKIILIPRIKEFRHNFAILISLQFPERLASIIMNAVKNIEKMYWWGV